MKNKLILISTLFFALNISVSNAQISIGKNTIDGKAILDFGSGTTNGIILPIVETLPTSGASATDGTLLMDKNDLKVKMRVAGTWEDLTDAGSVSAVTFNTTPEIASTAVIIGSNSSASEGVLVLESTTTALVLPKIADPHTTVKTPFPGMICYDTTSKTVAIFDGLKWNYWK